MKMYRGKKYYSNTACGIFCSQVQNARNVENIYIRYNIIKNIGVAAEEK